MDIVAVLVALLVILLFFKFVMPMKSYADTPAPSPGPASGTVQQLPNESVELGGKCYADTECKGHVSSGAYCSHNSKICKPARV